MQPMAALPNPFCKIPMVTPPSVLSVIGRTAREHSDRVAITDSNGESTYNELSAVIETFARQLRTLRVRAADRIVVYGGKKRWTISSLLGVFSIGATAVPIDEGLPDSRAAALIAAVQPKLVISTADGRFPSSICASTYIVGATGLVADVLPSMAVEAALPDDLIHSAAAYIFFTSGSSGKPKGVVGLQGALAHFCQWAVNELGFGVCDRVPQLASISFDAMLKDVLPTLMAGGTLLMPPERPYERPGALVEWLDRQEVTVIQTVPSVVASWLADAKRSFVTLRSLRLLCLAGEPLDATLVARWRRTFPSCRPEIVSLYGPTEGTILKSFHRVPENVRAGIVSLGRALPDTQLLVLNTEEQLCSVGELGEIVIRTPYLALGYLDGEDGERPRFSNNPFTGEEDDRIYRTGDLGRYEPDGTVSIAGRIDDEVKINGVRIQPAEINAILAKHPAVKSSVVLAVRSEDRQASLAAYVVMDERAELGQLRAHLLTHLPAAMVPSRIVPVDHIPLTANGKVDRKQLQLMDKDADSSPSPPVTPTQQVLASIWAQLLNRADIGIHQNFFEAGGHSLLLIRLISRIRTTFKVQVEIRSLFENPTIVEIASLIDERLGWPMRTALPAIKPKRVASLVPLSIAQRRLWVLSQLYPFTPAYNMTGGFRFAGSGRREDVERALNGVVVRHDSLQTSFRVVDTEPKQIVASNLYIVVPEHDLSGMDRNEQQAKVIALSKEQSSKPFDIEKAPLVRACLVHEDTGVHTIILTIHHIVCDGWSWQIIASEFDEMYSAIEEQRSCSLVSPRLQYGDFATWQQEHSTAVPIEDQLAYWRGILAAPISPLAIPTDSPRPPVFSFAGDNVKFEVPEYAALKFRELCVRNNVTMFMGLLAVFQVLLSRYTGSEDLVIGTDGAGRIHPDTEGIVGFFVTTQILRVNLSGNPTFVELLGRVRDVSLAAHAHQDVPFERLVEEFETARDLSRSPLFQVMFRMPPTPLLQQPRVEMLSFTEAQKTAKFDLTLSLSETADRLVGTIEYYTAAFSRKRVEIMSRQFCTLISEISSDSGRKISVYTLGRDPDTGLPDPHYPILGRPQAHVINLFQQAAAHYPERIAIRQGSEQITYSKLAELVSEQSSALRASHPEQPTIVVVHGEKSIAVVANMLAVWTAGGVVVPLDKRLPESRKKQMLEASNASCVLGDPIAKPAGPSFTVRQDHLTRNVSNRHCSVPLSEDVPAYIFFTSGTTGLPKPIVGLHKSLSHFIAWENREFDIRPDDCVAQITSLSFDAVLRDILVPLTSGSSLSLPIPADLADPRSALEWFQRDRVTIIHTTPSIFRAWTDVADQPTQRLGSLRIICLAGEPLRGEDVIRWRVAQSESSAAVFNFYGPTEATMIKSFHRVPENVRAGIVSLGRALPDTQLLVLNTEEQLCSVGELGEIVIRTPYLALGYLDGEDGERPRFSNNPFTGEEDDRIYRTGDLGRYEPDGTVSIAGRIDDEVKINGVRIQPAEINAILAKHPAVKSSVVLAVRSEDRQASLAAYVVMDERAELGQLRAHLLTHLPAAMVPSRIVPVDHIPLTANGKVDRKQLQLMDRDADSSPSPPVTPTQQVLASIWAQLLNRADIGIHQNFFEAGGHSLLATIMVAKARKAFGISLPLRALFEGPTIADLATYLESARLQNHVSGSVLQQLSDGTKPLVCLHPAGGSPLCYRELAAAMAPQCAVYALNGLRVENISAIQSIPELASIYLWQLRSAFANRRIALAGWSLGGLIALELGRQWLADGGSLSLLALIDTLPPKPGCRADQEVLRRSFQTDMETLGYNYSSATTSDEDYSAELDRHWLFFRRMREIAADYTPKPVQARTVLCRAVTSAPGSDGSQPSAWSPEMTSSFEMLNFCGDHYSLLKYPQVKAIAETLRKRLE